MNLSDITKINFGSAGISAVYNGGIKLWPTGTGESNKVMKFTTFDGQTWNNNTISAYTADNTYITPVAKDATGWTYDKDVEYIISAQQSAQEGNLLTFEGFEKPTKYKSADALFSCCEDCSEVNTTNMDMSECANLSYMFQYAAALTTLDFSNWDTSQVTDANGIFYGCSNLASVKLSNWNTSKVTNMRNMFLLCNKLATLDLSNWDLTKVYDIDDMFKDCSALTTVKMTNCSQDTKDKIRAALDAAGLTSTVITE